MTLYEFLKSRHFAKPILVRVLETNDLMQWEELDKKYMEYEVHSAHLLPFGECVYITKKLAKKIS